MTRPDPEPHPQDPRPDPEPHDPKPDPGPQPDLRAQAERWLAEDPDPRTRIELAGLLERGDTAGLADRFAAPLAFGTAGLRGELGAGPRRMNRVVVQRAAAGLAAYLAERPDPGPVVIGYDARHNSRVFGTDTAEVLAGAGRRALLLPGPLPTPVLAFAIRHLRCAAGVMVTASHNPPQDNGYKVYLGDGAQVVPPTDTDLAEAIAAVGALADLPRETSWEQLGDDVVDAYVDAVTRLPRTRHREIRVAYTPLHGVGGEVLLAAFARAGFPPPAVVAEQAEPDPDFPTVSFPNPEEPGAMDLLLRTAAATGAQLAIANDPDADRLAVAVPDGAGWRVLTGDELGALLADHLLRHGTGTDRLVVTTVVSATVLTQIAAAAGVRFAETLTGFKWIVRAPGPGDRFVFGYEEALGYCVGGDGAVPPVRDKDGIGAALVVAEIAAEAAVDGGSIPQILDRLARAHGVHATGQLSLRTPDAARIAAVLARLRADPPAHLAGRRVTATIDLRSGGTGLPPTDAVVLRLGEEARVVVRPSGTEPKLKAYLEVVVPAGADLAAARARAAEELQALHDAVDRLVREDPSP